MGSILRRLLEQSGFDREAEQILPENASRILFHIELDNVRYSIVCSRTESPSARSFAPLSNRERQIVDFVCAGLPNKTIAHKLAISPWTVATYMRRIFVKLGVNSRAEMIAKLMRSQYMHP